MFAKGISSVTAEKKQNISDADILGFYLGVTQIPSIINSPLRKDNNPSFGLFSFDGVHVFYRDFATRESGSTIKLFKKLWNLSYADTWNKIVSDIKGNGGTPAIKKVNINTKVDALSKERSKIDVVVRDWAQHDLDYWQQYGIFKEWLEYADIHAISHILFTKNNYSNYIVADKYAYTYVEFKDNITTHKIYQPFNKKGCKWFNNHDGSVISLWTKIPEHGDKLCICSSVKDALCLWANTGIPAIAPQGEGYGMSEHAISDLKARFKKIYIIFDNDKPGIIDGLKLAEKTGFTNVVLPAFRGGKDISDYYKSLINKQQFIKTIKTLLV